MITVISIGGATRSGKTTLSRALYENYSKSENLLVYHIGQDTYFKEIKPKYHIDNLYFDNWECPEAIDFDKFYNGIIAAKNDAKEKLQNTNNNNGRVYSKAIIIVEGFLLYHDERISNLFDLKFFIAIPKQLCHARRLKINSEWKFPEPNFEVYFEQLIWPNYVRFNKRVCLMNDVHVIDGLQPKEQIFQNFTSGLNGDASLNYEKLMLQRSFSRIVFVLGRPGSGKGTQCDSLKVKYNIEHLSVGDLLRSEVANNGPNSVAIKQSIEQGILISKEISLNLLKNAMDRINEQHQEKHQLSANFVIDGYPSSLDRAESFEQMFGPCDVILHLRCEPDVVQERLLARGRSDDTEECIRNRLNTFTENMLPVVEHYRKLGRLIEVDAAQSKEKTLAEVKKILTHLNILRDKPS